MKATYTLWTADVRAATALWYKTWNPSPSYISKSAGALMLFLGTIGLLGCLRSIEESFRSCVLAFAIAFFCFRFSSLQIRSHARAFLAACSEGKLEQSVDVTPYGLVFTGPSTRLEYAWGF